MKAIIKWHNGYESYVGAYYNETVKEFKHRVLKSYQRYNVPIFLQIYEDGEGYYIHS